MTEMHPRYLQPLVDELIRTGGTTLDVLTVLY